MSYLRFAWFATVLAICFVPFLAPAMAAPAEPVVAAAEDLHWQAAPGLPPGAEIAVLYGDPSKSGPFAIRLKFPAGYNVASHSHPTDELITFLSGTSRMAFGDDATEDGAKAMQPGTFMALPAGALHTLWVDTPTVIELHSTGPFETHLH
jgi:mannose-6-phosphate isomerase-like protein (cupin superfamily)